MKRMNLKEYRYMGDNDIAAQYDDMKITYFEINRLRNSSEGWKGVFELEFPNADDIDYDSTKSCDFIVYDNNGDNIAWDCWLPKSQTDKLENIIRQEISKKVQNESLKRIRTIVSETVNRVLKENGNLYGMQKLTGRELYDRIDSYLSEYGDAYVSRGYSDKNWITVALNNNICDSKTDVIKLMQNLGYSLYDSGSSGKYLMLTFKA